MAFNSQIRIRPELIAHVETKVIPMYSKFDDGHNVQHVRDVLEKSHMIGSSIEELVDPNIVYTVAAYHDVGRSIDVYAHEKYSAIMLLDDEKIKQWFSESEMEIMAQAIIDHRASSDHEPKSIYGKIVADGDRKLDFNTYMRRTVQFNLHQFPNLTKKEYFEKVIEHMREKYGRGGYIKLWLNYKDDVEKLAQITERVEGPVDMLRRDFSIDYEIEIAE